MTKLTNEQIEQILEGAPEGATYYGIINPNQVFYSDGIIGCCNTIWIENYDDGGYLEVEEDGLCIYGFDEFRVLSDLREILSLRQEVERLSNPWISVEDELPPNNVNKVYVWDSKNDPWISTKEDNESWDRDWISVDGTTHWQHLPKTPKEKDHEC